jgi:tetratricopeptide (TPR) repeat protein
LLVENGQLERAVFHAVKAFDFYPLKDERLPYLAHDLGYLLIRMRYFRLALHALDAAPAHGFLPHYLGVVYATIAQAAGGAGRVARYETAERASLGLVDASEEFAAAARASLAEGARSLGRWDVAERHARASLRIARSRHDREAAREAVTLVRVVLRREASPSMETPPADAPVAMLTRRIAARLRSATPRRGSRV